MLILFNGKFIPEEKPIITATSEAFQFGLGAFETLRTYNKILFKPVEHVDRLFQSAERVGLQTSITKKSVLSDLQKIVQKSPYPEQRIKIILVREGTIITSQKLTLPKDFKRGVSLQSTVQRRAFPESKTLAYLDSYVVRMEAVHNGFYDGLLLDDQKNVYEGSYSNIFWFEEDTLCTRMDRVLPGITAQTVLELSPFKKLFRSIKYEDLLQKKEIFLTQTSSGILPVTRIDKHLISGGKVGERTKKIMQAFDEYARNYK